jgi:hypothetical protein
MSPPEAPIRYYIWSPALILLGYRPRHDKIHDKRTENGWQRHGNDRVGHTMDWSWAPFVRSARQQSRSATIVVRLCSAASCLAWRSRRGSRWRSRRSASQISSADAQWSIQSAQWSRRSQRLTVLLVVPICLAICVSDLAPLQSSLRYLRADT